MDVSGVPRSSQTDSAVLSADHPDLNLDQGGAGKP